MKDVNLTAKQHTCEIILQATKFFLDILIKSRIIEKFLPEKYEKYMILFYQCSFDEGVATTENGCPN